jgi:ligand-binding SRPBCC domain-containing protein
LKEGWDYFSSPANLSKITPRELGFEIITELPQKMYQGMIIQYFVKPLFNLRVRWITEITHVNEPYFFVDEQRGGPYKLWHHQHRFIETEGGIIMEDEVNYAIPFGILGQILNYFIIKSKVEDIFEYRSRILKTLFPGNLNLNKDAA